MFDLGEYECCLEDVTDYAAPVVRRWRAHQPPARTVTPRSPQGARSVHYGIARAGCPRYEPDCRRLFDRGVHADTDPVVTVVG